MSEVQGKYQVVESPEAQFLVPGLGTAGTEAKFFVSDWGI
jgi:hypothetical protein